MNTLTPDFSAAHQEQNLKAIQKRKAVEIVDINNDVKLIDSQGKIYYAGKSATVKVGEKKALIYLALTPFVIDNVIGRMFINGYDFKKKS
jgi:hypothetical protein